MLFLKRSSWDTGEGANGDIAMQEGEMMLEWARLWGAEEDGVEDSEGLVGAQAGKSFQNLILAKLLPAD